MKRGSRKRTRQDVIDDTYKTDDAVPSWNAEYILHKRFKTTTQRTRNNSDESNNDDDVTPTTTSQHAIQERYWWKNDHPNSSCPKSDNNEFNNIGYEIWNASRAEWKSYKKQRDTPAVVGDTAATISTTAVDPSRSKANSKQTTYKTSELVQGLTNLSREFALPQVMNLKDLIEVYVDIWENHE
eukprot:scaffold4598_cov73-Cyclotella_meneghiniana.AAC.7